MLKYITQSAGLTEDRNGAAVDKNGISLGMGLEGGSSPQITPISEQKNEKIQRKLPNVKVLPMNLPSPTRGKNFQSMLLIYCTTVPIMMGAITVTNQLYPAPCTEPQDINEMGTQKVNLKHRSIKVQ